MKPMLIQESSTARLSRGAAIVWFAALALLISGSFSAAFAQTAKWSGDFIGGQKPSDEICQSWSSFISSLDGRKFVSVKLFGSADPNGKLITDPAAATELARLLATRTPGVVMSGSDQWIVKNNCGVGACGTQNISISVNGDPNQCLCEEPYTLRPNAVDGRWGGLNGSACSSPSQTINLEFYTGVSITANGPTSICPGESVTLVANAEICSPPLTYLWSNGATTPSITVSEAGEYYVTVTGANGACSGISEKVVISLKSEVNAGPDVTTCLSPVQLNANVTTTTQPAGPSSYCIFDAGGGSCNFTNPCGDALTPVTESVYSKLLSGPAPEKATFLVYFSLYATKATFTFTLNGQTIGTSEDLNNWGTCVAPPNQYPLSVSFTKDQLSSWLSVSANELAVKVTSSGDDALYVAGVVLEIENTAPKWSWSPSTGLDNALIQNPIASPLTTTTYTVTYTDVDGCSVSDQVIVKVECPNAPVAVCKELTRVVDANCTASILPNEFDGGSTDPTNNGLTFTVEPAGPYPLGVTKVKLTVKNSSGTSTCETQVTVTNPAPAFTSVVASASELNINSLLKLTTEFVDNNIEKATINWGDQSPVETVMSPASTFENSHAYAAAGVYTVTITLTDLCGASTSYVVPNIAVLAVNQAGTVSGSGTFDSKVGYYLKDKRASGKAQFHFKVTSRGGNASPTGNLNFKFKSGKLEFKSTMIESVNISGDKATIVATGRVGSKKNYRILVAVVDTQYGNDTDRSSGATDKIRVKAWDPSGAVIYDTQSGAPDDAIAAINILTGDILIDSDNSDDFKSVIEDLISSLFGGEGTSVYPNPFVDHIYIQFNSTSAEDVKIQLMTLTGKTIVTQILPASSDGSYRLDVPENAPGGIYILVIQQGSTTEFLRLVHK